MDLSLESNKTCRFTLLVAKTWIEFSGNFLIDLENISMRQKNFFLWSALKNQLFWSLYGSSDLQVKFAYSGSSFTSALSVSKSCCLDKFSVMLLGAVVRFTLCKGISSVIYFLIYSWILLHFLEVWHFPPYACHRRLPKLRLTLQ